MNRVLIRVIGAPLLLGGLAVCVYADYLRESTAAITILVGLFAALSFHELCAMAKRRDVRPAEIVGLAAIVFIFSTVLRSDEPYGPLLIASLAVLFLLLLRMVFAPRAFAPPDAGTTLLAFAYVSLLLFIPLGMPAGTGWLYWLLFLVATNKGSDMAAYVVGKSIGRHQLAPSISPNKTWEGSIGGLLVGTVLGYVVLRTWLGEETGGFRGVAMAAAVTVAAQLGDLVKSAIKRWAGVKDSGRLLPEFGGALDMVDSFILSAPVAQLFLRLS